MSFKKWFSSFFPVFAHGKFKCGLKDDLIIKGFSSRLFWPYLFFLFSLCLFTLLFFLFRWLLIWMQGVCICAGNPTRVKMHRCAEVKPLRMLMILDQKPQQQMISVCVSSSKAATRFCRCFAHMEAYVSEVECSSIAQERDISSPNPLFVPSTHNAMHWEMHPPSISPFLPRFSYPLQF